MKLSDLFEQLEGDIVNRNYYKRCFDFEPLCVQCQFWAMFDNIKSKIKEYENDEENECKKDELMQESKPHDIEDEIKEELHKDYDVVPRKEVKG